MKFEIINSNYKPVRTNLDKYAVLQSFTSENLSEKGFFIRDNEGLDMKFNEFLEMYCQIF